MDLAVKYGCPWSCFIGQPMLFDGGLFINREPFTTEWEYKMNLDGRIMQMEIMNDFT